MVTPKANFDPNKLKSIIVKDFTNIQEEAIANAEIAPGMLVELMSTNKLRKHATAAGNAAAMFAIENELEGQGVDTVYAAADIVQYRIFRPGDMVNAILANEENVAIGDFLESNGYGFLRKYVAAKTSFDVDQTAVEIDADKPKSIIAIAMEALDLSGSSAEESFIIDGTLISGLNRRITVRIV